MVKALKGVNQATQRGNDIFWSFDFWRIVAAVLVEWLTRETRSSERSFSSASARRIQQQHQIRSQSEPAHIQPQTDTQALAEVRVATLST